MKIVFFEIRPGEQDFLSQNLTGQELYFSDLIVDATNIPSEFLDLDVISTHTLSKIDQSLIDKLPNLKLIATRTTGFDQIDLKAASQKGIHVCNVPFYGENTVAEFAFGLILTIGRKIPEALNRVKGQRKFEFWGLQGFDLKDKTLGVIGTGHIGANVIKMAKGFSMNVVAFDAFPNQELSNSLGFKYLPLPEVLSSSDVISIHVPALKETFHLLNQTNLPGLKKGAILINTSRGSVIETEALLQVLENKTLSAAGLDVLENEDEFKKELLSGDQNNQSINMKLLKMENVYITPHTAFNTKEAEVRILQTTVENINGFFKGESKNEVKPT